MKRHTIICKDGHARESMTLRALRDRLTEIIDENERRGWPERNEHAVVLTVEQPRTPSGRRRQPQYHTVAYACGSCLGLPALMETPAGVKDYGVVPIMSGEMLRKPRATSGKEPKS